MGYLTRTSLQSVIVNQLRSKRELADLRFRRPQQEASTERLQVSRRADIESILFPCKQIGPHLNEHILSKFHEAGWVLEKKIAKKRTLKSFPTGSSQSAVVAPALF